MKINFDIFNPLAVINFRKINSTKARLNFIFNFVAKTDQVLKSQTKLTSAQEDKYLKLLFTSCKLLGVLNIVSRSRRK